MASNLVRSSNISKEREKSLGHVIEEVVKNININFLINYS